MAAIRDDRARGVLGAGARGGCCRRCSAWSAAIGIYYLFAGASQAVPGLKGDGISALHLRQQLAPDRAGSNYFAASGPVSPLEHTWSLAIEEQFYLVWPLVVLAVLWLAGRRAGANGGAAPLVALLVLSVAGAIASALDMGLLFDGGRNLNRVYYGTDTRAFGLLFGATLAIGFALVRTTERAERPALEAAPAAWPGRWPCSPSRRRSP